MKFSVCSVCICWKYNFILIKMHGKTTIKIMTNILYSCCIVDGYYCCVVDKLFLFCRIVLCTVCKSYAYFIVLSPCLSVNHTICLHFYFLVRRPGVGGIEFPLISFCLYVAALNIYRASNVWGHECKIRLPCAPVAVCRLSRKMTGSFEWSWKICECGNEETHNHGSRTPYISLVTTLFAVYAQ
jgi:hypothetical protein